MDASHDLADFGIRGIRHSAGIEDNELRRRRLIGCLIAAAREHRLDRRAIGLRSPAPEIMNYELRHVPLVAPLEFDLRVRRRR